MPVRSTESKARRAITPMRTLEVTKNLLADQESYSGRVTYCRTGMNGKVFGAIARWLLPRLELLVGIIVAP